MKRKILTAVICIIFTICFASPAPAIAPINVSIDANYVGGINVEYRGRAKNGTSFISCGIVYDDIHVDIPEEEQNCFVKLIVYEVSEEEGYIIQKSSNSLSVYKSGNCPFEPYYYRFQYNACGHGLLVTNY